MGKAMAKAKEVYGVAADWTEKNVAPVVGPKMADVKAATDASIAQLTEEGLMTEVEVKGAYEVSLAEGQKAVAEKGPYAVSVLVGDLPFHLLSKVGVTPPTITKPDPKGAFIVFNLLSLALGYFDVTLFALVHLFGDASDLGTYLPMYVLKLAFDLAVCTAITYGLHFIYVKSTSLPMQKAGLCFLGFLVVYKFLTGFFSPLNLLAWLEFLVITFLLIRASLITFAAPTAYAELKEDISDPAE